MVIQPFNNTDVDGWLAGGFQYPFFNPVTYFLASEDGFKNWAFSGRGKTCPTSCSVFLTWICLPDGTLTLCMLRQAR